MSTLLERLEDAILKRAHAIAREPQYTEAEKRRKLREIAKQCEFDPARGEPSGATLVGIRCAIEAKRDWRAAREAQLAKRIDR